MPCWVVFILSGWGELSAFFADETKLEESRDAKAHREEKFSKA
jgi:hypothetical protein